MIPLADIKTYIGLTATTAEEDALLEQLEAAAVAHFERTTHRYFGPPVLITDILPGNSRAHLFLSEQPIEAEGVVVTERWRQSDDGTLLEDVALRSRRLVRDTAFLLGYEYTAEYLAGYGAGEGDLAGVTGHDVPADVWRAIAEIVKASWQSRTTNEAMKSETISGYSYTRADGDAGTLALPPYAQQVIGNWARKVTT